MRNFLRLMKVDKGGTLPMYQQIYQSIECGVKNGNINSGDHLPSINDVCCALEMSKNTVERAYNELKKYGIIESYRGKGYFIPNSQIKRKKVLLVFNKLSASKKIIYDSFMSVIGSYATVDLCVYNNSSQIFSQLINEKIRDYSHFVIIPPTEETDMFVFDTINKIPAEKLFILDRQFKFKQSYQGAVYQDFQKDIFGALEQLHERLIKYEKVKIVFPYQTAYYSEILNGFRFFCMKNSLSYEVISDIDAETIKKDVAYVILNEDDLVTILEKIISSKLKLGKQIGLISYNESPWKRIIFNGLTTISADFQLMGEKIAQMILSNSDSDVAIPFVTVCRNSL